MTVNQANKRKCKNIYIRVFPSSCDIGFC